MQRILGSLLEVGYEHVYGINHLGPLNRVKVSRWYFERFIGTWQGGKRCLCDELSWLHIAANRRMLIGHRKEGIALITNRVYSVGKYLSSTGCHSTF